MERTKKELLTNLSGMRENLTESAKSRRNPRSTDVKRDLVLIFSEWNRMIKDSEDSTPDSDTD